MKPIILPIAPPGYRPQSTDCSIESDLLQFELLRRWSPTQRLMQAASLMRSARQLSLNSHHQRFPQLSTTELGQRLAQAWLQEYCPLEYIPTGVGEWAGKLSITADYIRSTIEAGVSDLSNQ